MSTYTYTDEDRDTLLIEGFASGNSILVTARGMGGQRSVRIPETDVPTVAAELLKAAGQEGVFVASASAEVVDRGDYAECGMGTDYAMAPLAENPDALRTRGLNFIALAAYIESKAQRETEAATKLQERRDALSYQLTGDFDDAPQVPYSNRTVPMRKAIDRIIELEDAQAA